jgi:hypothetical protein
MREVKQNGNCLMLAGTGAGTQNSPEDEIRALGYLQSTLATGYPAFERTSIMVRVVK